MDALEFVLIIAVFATILGWYLRNVSQGADGRLGLLALTAETEIISREEKRRSYRIKPRIAQRAHERRGGSRACKIADKAKPSYRRLDEGERMRRRFRRQDEARYRVKDKVPPGANVV